VLSENCDIDWRTKAEDKSVFISPISFVGIVFFSALRNFLTVDSLSSNLLFREVFS